MNIGEFLLCSYLTIVNSCSQFLIKEEPIEDFLDHVKIVRVKENPNIENSPDVKVWMITVNDSDGLGNIYKRDIIDHGGSKNTIYLIGSADEVENGLEKWRKRIPRNEIDVKEVGHEFLERRIEVVEKMWENNN